MNTRNRFTKALALGATALVMLTCVAVWRAAHARAAGTDAFRTGLISLGAGQTARLNVLLGGPDTTPGGERGARITLGFDIYAIGDVENSPDPTSPPDTLNNLRFVRRESRVVVLKPGEGAFLDFSAPEGGTHISAVMLVAPDASRAIGNPDIMPTLELMEGGSPISINIKWFNPQPDPPGGL